MESVTVENYLKAIYQLSDAAGGAPPASWPAA